MAFKIERAFTGLFNILRLQSQGSLPSVLSEGVQATYDLGLVSLQALQARTRHIPAAAVPLSLGIVADAILTNDLYVTGVSIEWFAAQAGDGVTLGLYYRRPAASTSPFMLHQYSSGFNLSTNTGEALGSSLYLGQPVWLPANSSVYLACSRLTLGGAGVPEGFGQLLTYDPRASG